MTPQHRTDALWLALVAATALAWSLGDAGGAGSGWTLAAVWALAAAKGTGIALEFMALRQAPALWRRLVLGWLVVVVGGLALIGLLA